MNRLRRLALAATLPAAVLAACGGSGPAATPATVSVSASEYAFDPAAITIPASGATVTLTNGGIVEHDITVDALNVKILAKAGETAEGQVSGAAGTYEFYCSIPGHKEAGMLGTLTLE
ncbi:MAG TPA: plastocyanin/azurin family copper-binding protein [Candidatus Limnocylindrales bacterium]|nr:plastocyanin/azurin family copper-binding protein [Candidatus Limnocylindrales bacterium]